MAKSVTGASPVTFVSEDTAKGNEGTQYQIPLPLISYDPTSATPVTFTWATPPTGFDATTDSKLAASLIEAMIAQGLLTVGA